MLGSRPNIYLAAVLLRGVTPIRISSRTPKTHPECLRLYQDKDRHVCDQHAEMRVLITGHSNPGDSVVVLRWLSNGDAACSKPCPLCTAKLKELRIKHITYFDKEGHLVTERVSKLHSDYPTVITVISSRTRRAMREFNM